MTVGSLARVLSGGTLIKRILLIALTTAFAVSNSGCLVVGGTLVYLVAKNAAEAEGRALKDGWLEETLPYPIDSVEAATGGVLEANAMPVSYGSAENGTRVVESRYGDGLDVRIELAEPSPYSTAVRIHVGPEGDLGRSAHLMDTIAEFCQPADS